MGGILPVIVPIYIAVGIGFITVRTGLIPRAALAPLGDFVVKLALPATLFGTLASRHVADLVDVAYLLAYACGSLIATAFGYLAMRALARRRGLDGRGTRVRSAYAGLGSGTSNSGYVGFPVLQGSMPQVAAPAFGMNVLVENLLMIPLGLALAERAAGSEVRPAAILRSSALRVARNPMVIAILAGALVALLGLPLPEVVRRVVAMFAAATTAPALFIIGGTLVGQSLRGQAAWLTPILAGKLLVHPLAVAAIAFALTAAAPLVGLAPMTPELRAAAIVSAAVPTMSIFPILAARHGEEGVMSQASFACTAASLVTMTAALLLVHPG